MEGDVKTGNFIEIIEFEDGTKYKKQYENFILILESYFKNEILHRDNDLPAQIKYFKDGKLARLNWYKNGDKYESNTPSEIFYNLYGIIRQQEWCYRNESTDHITMLRIQYYANGNIASEFKYDCNLQRMYDYILYDEFGNIKND